LPRALPPQRSGDAVRRGHVRGGLGVSFVTANKLVEQLAQLDIVDEITGRRRDRIFSYTPFVELFRDEPAIAEGEVQETVSDLGG